ncbi:MAG: cell division protein FtsX, partial [Candidatus Marinimicrobia bacterium CG_4_10_14_0_2_um_filter_48_9]
MNLSFIFKEGLSGFKRAKFPFIVSVVTLSICLTLIGVSIMIGDNIFGYFREV